MKSSCWNLLKAVGLCVLMSFSSMIHAASSPESMLQTSADEMTNVLKANQSRLKNDPVFIYNTVRKYLLPHVDVAGMSRSVLGREAWLKASASEKQAFSQAFTRLVIRTYAGPLSKYNGETVHVHPVRGGVQGRFIRVESDIIRTSGPTIPVSYSLVSKGGEWKIYDLSVEGVSLLQSFRSQFAEALRKSSLAEVTTQMEHQQLHQVKS